MKIETNKETVDAISAIISEQEDDNGSKVRLYVAGFGWSGPSFGLALDEQGENDLVDSSNEVTFIMDKDLHEQFGDIKVESQGEGFVVMPVGQEALDCGSCAGC